MPRILVMSESSEREGAVIFDERVSLADMRSDHHAAQLLQRVGWAVHDADEAEADTRPG